MAEPEGLDNRDCEGQAPALNPYVGPRSFDEEHSCFFFGRDEEQRHLTSLIIAHRAVLFYAQSGAGKTSLLRASVLPELKRRKNVVVLPSARVGGELPPGVAGDQVANIYVFNVLLKLAGAGAEPGELAHLSLREGLAAHVQPEAGKRRPHPRLLILDQFEELFTSHPERSSERAGFFRQLAECLAAYPQLSLLLSMREDYVARLDYYAAQMPNRLRTRFRMERLPVSGALEAVQKPAERAGRPFEPGVAEGLVDNLRRIQVGAAREGSEEQTALGEYVEPVHLQIVCWQLWENLLPGGDTIRAQDVQAFGDVDQALSEFYEGTLEKVAEQTGIGGRRVRSWFDEELITPAQTRGLVYRGREESGGLPNEAVEILNEAYIIRAVIRGGDTWYELAHDRLVEPILASNRTWRETHLSPLQRQAELWEEQGRPAGLLLRDEALEDAEAWAAANPAELADVERAFLRACREARAVAERERRQARRIRMWAVVAAVIAVMAMVAAVFAVTGQIQARNAGATAIAEADARATEVVVRKAAEAAALDEAKARATAQVRAQNREKEALEAQAEAERQTRIALSRQLAAQSVSQLNGNSWELAMLLAIEAGRVDDTAEAFDALRQAFAHRGRTELILSPDWGQRGVDGTLRELSIQSATWNNDGSRILAETGDTVRIWDAETGKELLVLTGHEDLVRKALWNADESRILTASGDGTARVWDAATGVELLTLASHEGAVYQAVWNADESRILTAGCDQVDTNGFTCTVGTARVWDAATGVELLTLAGHEGAVYQAVWNAGQSRILTASDDGTARVWDVETGKELLSLSGSWAVWNTDGTRILTAGCVEWYYNLCEEGAALVWDAETGDELLTLSLHENSVDQAVWNADESRILTISSWWGTALWDAETGKELFNLSDDWAAWNADGSRILTASRDGTVRVRDAETGEALLTLSGHEDRVNSAAWNADQSRILTASDDGTARVWDTRAGSELPVLPGYEATWSADESRILTASRDGTARVWDAETGEALLTLSGHEDEDRVYSAVWNGDESRILTFGWDGKVRVWDAGTEHELFVLSDDVKALSTATWNTDESRILTYGCDIFDTDGVCVESTVRVWDAKTGEQLDVLDGGYVFILGEARWNTNGSRILASTGNTVRIWDAETGKEVLVLTGHEDLVRKALWNADESRILTASGDGTARVWDAETGKQLLTLAGHEDSVNSAVWDADESRILTASNDRTARVWDAETGKQLLTLAGHEDSVNSAMWNADESRILTASDDGTARVWDAETGKVLFSLSDHAGPVGQATWSADSSRILTTGSDDTVRQWYAGMENLLAAACRIAPRNLLQSEWQQYFGSLPYGKTCPKLPGPDEADMP